jgi:hypothetical protein
MANRPLARAHSLYIEDFVWNHLTEHAAKRGESASQFTNGVLRAALSLEPIGVDYRFNAIGSEVGTAMDPVIAVSPTIRPESEAPQMTAQQQRDAILRGVSTKKERK